MVNYKKAFEKLVDQIETEEKWANEQYETDCRKGKEKGGMDTFAVERYDRGMMFAYRSIRELAEQLKNGTFEFDDE